MAQEDVPLRELNSHNRAGPIDWAPQNPIFKTN